MIRSTRTLASLLLAASIGFTTFGVSPASAAPGQDETTPGGSSGSCQVPTGSTDFSSFLPTVNPGSFKSDTEGSVFITNPGTGGRQSWERIFAYLGEELGNEVVDDFNSVLANAEKQYDKKGKGDTSSTSDNEHFRTQQVKNGYAVTSTNGGGVVGVYDDEKKANAVANALEAEMDEKTEELNTEGDPCILIFDFSRGGQR